MDNKQFNNLSTDEKEKFIDPHLLASLSTDVNFEELYNKSNLKNVPHEWIHAASVQCIDSCSQVIPIYTKTIAGNVFEIQFPKNDSCYAFEDLFLEQILKHIKNVITANGGNYKEFKLVFTWPTMIEDENNTLIMTI